MNLVKLNPFFILIELVSDRFPSPSLLVLVLQVLAVSDVLHI